MLPTETPWTFKNQETDEKEWRAYIEQNTLQGKPPQQIRDIG